MSYGKHQHIVPRQMIKRFAGSDGKLMELHKPTLTIGMRRKGPGGILFKDDFYKDCLSDFDEELLQKVEQKFARYYPAIADHEKPQPLSGDGGAALIDWIAAMLCRTRALTILSQVIAYKENRFFSKLLSLMNNTLRCQWYNECQDLLTRTEFKWEMGIFPKESCIVLTDHPVCQTNGLEQGGAIFMVPLSKRHILFGGHQQAIERCRDLKLGQVNTFLAAWADKSIFAADRNTLEAIKLNLEGKGNVGTDQWCETARKPFFGALDRITLARFPSDQDLSTWWEQLKSSYGQPLLEQ